MITARMIAADWCAAQQKLASLWRIHQAHRIASSMDRHPDAVRQRAQFLALDEVTLAHWQFAVQTQQRECHRCGQMLAINFEAANDGGGEAPDAA